MARGLVCDAAVRKCMKIKALERGLGITQVDPAVFAALEALVVRRVDELLGHYMNYGRRRGRKRLMANASDYR